MIRELLFNIKVDFLKTIHSHQIVMVPQSHDLFILAVWEAKNYFSQKQSIH
eukprot:TRINITY_DN1810_c0_g1_i1.p2 TRINITY_DN1810_c0_g1~~TRINITY_DN1810_c0_g1_i1.p2  ORF type:complete len:51 (-),score=3.42 TRINITY_DN1810_c0_g1_i1:168-320(-)